MQLLDPRQDGGEGAPRPAQARSSAPAPARTTGRPPAHDEYDSPEPEESGGGSDIPF